MSEQSQLGFSFETEAELIATSVEESEFEQVPGEIIPTEPPSPTFLFREIEEEVRERESAKEEEIPWADYIRMVQLFFNEKGHEEFRELSSKLAVLYGTKNITDTVAEAMRNAANRPQL